MIIKKLTSIMLASGMILALPITSFAEPQNKNINTDSTVICATDTIIGYALQFNMDPNIPPIYHMCLAEAGGAEMAHLIRPTAKTIIHQETDGYLMK